MPFAAPNAPLGHPTVTNHCKVIESSEFFGERALAQEQRFAFVTPSLQVIGIVTILDEANNAILRFDMVATHDSGTQGAVRAFSVRRFGI
jgi:hypothetical protein